MIGYEQNIQPGDILSRPSEWPGIDHWGTAVGANLVAQTMPEGGKYVSSFAEFASGRMVRVSRPPYTDLQQHW